MERRQRGRGNRQRGGGNRQRRAAPAPPLPAPAEQGAAAIRPPYRRAGPPIDIREPTEQELFEANWGEGNENHLSEDEKVGRRFLPLPPTAPAHEAIFFVFKDSYKTGQTLTDVLMKPIYDNHLNQVGDKRREILHDEWRSQKLSKSLSDELEGLMSKVNAKIAKLTQLTNMVVPVPKFFNDYPALG